MDTKRRDARDAREEIDRAKRRKQTRAKCKTPEEERKSSEREKEREKRERATLARREGTKRENVLLVIFTILSSRGACLCLSAFEEETFALTFLLCDKCI